MADAKQDFNKDNVVRLRGLPFSATKQDIERFFGEEYEIVKDGILLPLSADGRASGQAYVQFSNEEDATKAIEKKNKQSMGHRYIELYASSMDEAYRSSQKFRGESTRSQGPKGLMNYNGKHLTGLRYPYGRGYGPNGPPLKGQRGNLRNSVDYEQMDMFRGLNDSSFGGMFGNVRSLSPNVGYPFLNTQTGNKPSMGGASGHKIQMRGLPYQVSEGDIKNWFSPVANALHVNIIHNHVGKPSGDAEVLFADETDAKKAMTKHKQNLQHRYIELYNLGPVGSPAKSLMGTPFPMGNRADQDKHEAANSSWENGWFTSGNQTGSGFKGNSANAFPLGGLGAQGTDMASLFGYYGYPYNMTSPY